MESWFHNLKGKYDIRDGWVGIDYSKSLLEPLEFKGTFMHEVSHALLSRKEFGQATVEMMRCLEDSEKFDEEIKSTILQSFYNEQVFTQEGLATLLQFLGMQTFLGESRAKQWATNTLPTDYHQRLKQFYFVLESSKKYRDLFTSKVRHIAMTTNIRKDMRTLDLLSDSQKLLNYLKQPDNSPDQRLRKLIVGLRANMGLLNKNMEIIANRCEVSLYKPPTKKDLADNLTYLAAYTKHPTVFSPEQIGNQVEDSEIISSYSSNLIIGNLNMDFEHTSEAIFNIEDFLFYASRIKVLFVSPNIGYLRNKDVLGELIGMPCEISFAALLNDGTKIITSLSFQKASEIINSQLKETTVLIKWGGYDVEKQKLFWSDTVRKPDLIIFNYPTDLSQYLDKVMLARPKTNFKYINIPLSAGHPASTMLVKEETDTPLYCLNSVANSVTTGILEKLGDFNSSSKFSEVDLTNYKEHINNLFSFWMGLSIHIDWVKSMIDKENVYFRV